MIRSFSFFFSITFFNLSFFHPVLNIDNNSPIQIFKYFFDTVYQCENLTLIDSGTGCIFDKMEERFYWFSSRAVEEVPNVLDAGGPAAYCSSLGRYCMGTGFLMFWMLVVLLPTAPPWVGTAWVLGSQCFGCWWSCFLLLLPG